MARPPVFPVSQKLRIVLSVLADGGRTGVNPRERALQAEIEELKAALGEAAVELRVWKRSAEYRLAPSRTSR